MHELWAKGIERWFWVYDNSQIGVKFKYNYEACWKYYVPNINNSRSESEMGNDGNNLEDRLDDSTDDIDHEHYLNLNIMSSWQRTWHNPKHPIKLVPQTPMSRSMRILEFYMDGNPTI